MAAAFEHLDPNDRAVAAAAAREVVRRGAALFTMALHACAGQVAFARGEGIAFDAGTIADTASDALVLASPATTSSEAPRASLASEVGGNGGARFEAS